MSAAGPEYLFCYSIGKLRFFFISGGMKLSVPSIDIKLLNFLLANPKSAILST